MDTLFLLGEYGKILCAFCFLMFLWPVVIFSRHLKGKSLTYIFSFCITMQILLITAVILLLGVCHILYGWVVAILFYGAFAFSVVRKVGTQTWSNWYRALKSLLAGTYGFKHFLREWGSATARALARFLQRVWHRLRSHVLEYGVLCALIAFAVMYFLYGPLHYYGYGTSDMFVHHQWVDALCDGDVFSAGIYPKGMHCVIYSLHVLFGISLYSCLQLLGSVQIIVILAALYLFLRGIFNWRYTPLFVLTLFLTVGAMSADEAFMMARLQWTLPQEFGMSTVFLSALFTVRYLNTTSPQKKGASGCKQRLDNWNSDLCIFAMSIAAATVIHFYCTIMALILCFPFAVFSLLKVRILKRALSLILALVIALGGVALPMVIAYGAGIPLEGSLTWALGVMNHTDTEEIPSADITASAGEILYRQGYVALYEEAGADFLLTMTAVAVALWAGYRLIWFLPRLRNNRKEYEENFDTYPAIVVASVLFMLVYVASYLGLPQIVAEGRLLTLERVLLFAVTMIPADMLFTLLRRVCRSIMLRVISIATIVGIYVTVLLTGSYRGYLFTQLAQYNTEVMVTDSIIRNFPPNSFTIVSTTSEMYLVNQFGRHEELLRFVEEVEGEEYIIPTEYIFVYVEKRPLQYGQYHFYGGPDWLGSDLYYNHYRDEWGRSLGRDINASIITAEAAQADLNGFTDSFEDYKDIRKRTILESRAYLWCASFDRLFPFEISVYYEDADFVCFCIQQNPEAPFNLAIENWMSAEDVEWNNPAADTALAQLDAVEAVG